MTEDKVDIADIEADVSKTQSRLVFTGIILFMCLIGFIVKTCTSMPPEPIRPDPSIECAKVPGAHWVPEEYKVVNNFNHLVSGYCDTKKQ